MRKTVIQPPRTIMEVHQMLPEGTRAEIINGSLIMSPAPNRNHQTVLLKIGSEILRYLESHPIGTVLIAPTDVYLDENNVFQPDIVFVSNKRAEISRLNGIHGAPDLVVEILSPSNKSHDLVTKKSLYAKFGISEYWIVEPEQKEATGYKLVGDEYFEFTRAVAKMQSIVLRTTIEF